MFSFFDMLDTYESRCVDRHEDGDLLVSTAAVIDSDHPYETAVAHPAFNGGLIVIVETYDTVEDAESGHQKWVQIMTAPELPAELKDVSTCGIVKLAAALGYDLNETFENED